MPASAAEHAGTTILVFKLLLKLDDQDAKLDAILRHLDIGMATHVKVDSPGNLRAQRQARRRRGIQNLRIHSDRNLHHKRASSIAATRRYALPPSTSPAAICYCKQYVGSPPQAEKAEAGFEHRAF